MLHISTNKRINEYVNNILKSGDWEIRHSKHFVLKHKTGVVFVVPPTPRRNNNCFDIFMEQYRRALRKIFEIQGVLQG